MTTTAPWTDDELDRVGSAEELDVASRRRDGELGGPRTIWVVRVGDDIYVRSVNGPTLAGVLLRPHFCLRDNSAEPNPCAW
jgi:hypothetical protein